MFRQQAEERDGVARERLLKAADAAEAHADAADKICEAFPPEETDDDWRYLLSAAQAGHVPSMVRFAFGFPLMRHMGVPTKALDGWIAYRDQAGTFMQRAVEAGDPAAFELAAHAYSRGQMLDVQLVPKDAVRSVAYWMAIERVASPSYVETVRANIRSITTRSNMTPDDTARAAAISTELSRQLTRVPQGGIDFSRGTFAADDGTHCEPSSGG